MPRRAIIRIDEADELTNLRYREKEERWIEICERFEYPGQITEIEKHHKELERIKERLKSLESLHEVRSELKR